MVVVTIAGSDMSGTVIAGCPGSSVLARDCRVDARSSIHAPGTALPGTARSVALPAGEALQPDFEMATPFEEDELDLPMGTPPPPNDDSVDPNEEQVLVIARRVSTGTGWELWRETPVDASGGTNEPVRIDQLDAGEVPDLVEWSTPEQARENVRANPAITITIVGNTVRITGNITFTGTGNNPAIAAQLLAALNATWSGSFGQYTVVTNLQVGTGSIEVDVRDGLGRAAILGLGGSTIRTFSQNGEVTAREVSLFAHEFGHVLGLMDYYDNAHGTGQPPPGYEGSIMYVDTLPPTWQNIRDIIEENEEVLRLIGLRGSPGHSATCARRNSVEKVRRYGPA